MKRRMLLAGLLAAIAAVTMGQDGGCSTETEPASDGRESAAPAANDGAGSAPEADPDGQFAGTCDYLLGDFTEGTEAGYKLVAGGEAENTGNVGIVARFDATWDQLGTDPVAESRTVRLRPGQSKDVNVTVLASQGQIDAHQSANGNCETEMTILRTFGRPQ